MDEVSFGLMTLKIVIGFISLFIVLTMTGRIGISQLTPIHFVFILLLDDFLGHIIYEKSENIMEYLYAVGLWTLIMLLIQVISMKFPRFRTFLQGEPIFIIQKGQLNRDAIRKAKLDVNQVRSLLRQQGIFSMREVEFGIVEPDGKLSVALKAPYKNPTIQDLNVKGQTITLPVILVMDGIIMRPSLAEHGLDEKWLKQELKKNGYDDVKRVFYAEWTKDGGLYVAPK